MSENKTRRDLPGWTLGTWSSMESKRSGPRDGGAGGGAPEGKAPREGGGWSAR